MMQEGVRRREYEARKLALKGLPAGMGEDCLISAGKPVRTQRRTLFERGR